MQREYGALRQADIRYRVLFHVATEAVLIVDAVSHRVIEANPAASEALDEPPEVLVGKPVTDLVEPRDRSALEAYLAALEAGAKPTELRVRLAGQLEGEHVLTANLFRQGSQAMHLLSLAAAGASAPTKATAARTARLVRVVDALPEAVVITSEDRRILAANPAFCELVSQANERQVLGQPIDRWLGRPGVDMGIILANLREHAVIRNFPSIVRSDFAPDQDASVVAAVVGDEKATYYGFAIRAVSSRVEVVGTRAPLSHTPDQLRELVGRVPLKDLVRESADLIEKLCIEAALEVSGDNRASAAHLLGLSRQGLYSKLRRYGIAEFDS
jgi:transcriptional regulator PpsR